VAALEVVLEHQARRLELRQHAIDRGQPDLLATGQQVPVDVLGGHVPRLALLQQF
jgi:hypothetical protein